MWPSLITEISSRLLAARTYLSAVVGPQGTPTILPPPAEELTAKGLLFVQLYAVYEHSVNEMVRLAIGEIKSRPTQLNTVRLELLALILNPELQSVLTCGLPQKWKTRSPCFRRSIP